MTLSPLKAIRLSLLLTTAMVFPVGQAVPAGATPLARGVVVRDVARVTFEWPDPVEFAVDAHGTTVSILFERKADPDFGGLLSSLYPYITRASIAADGKTVVLTLDKPYKIRTFKSGALGGIELMGIDPAVAIAARGGKPGDKKPTPEQQVAQAIKAPTVAAEKVKTPAPAPLYIAAKEAPKKLPAAKIEVTKVEPKAQQLAKLSPAAGAPETPVAPVVAAKVEEPKVALPSTKTVAAAAGDSAPKATPAGESIKSNIVNVSTSDDSATLRFPLSERTAFAVFTRNHHLWVVLGKPVKLDVSEFADLEKTVIGKPVLIKNPKATILQMPIDDSVSASVTKEEGSDSWAILLTQQKRPMAAPLHAEVNTTPPAPPHVFIPALEPAESITVMDPQIGDELLVTPLYKSGEGVPRMRNFIEFSLLETAQGVAVTKKSDDVAIVQLRNGLRVSTAKGATITPGLPVISEQAAAADTLASSPTLFPNDLWQMDNYLARSKLINKSFHKIVESEKLQDSNAARIRLAQLYLSDGMAAEALGMLDGVNRTSPAIYRSNKLNALRGAANFLLGRYPEAARDFGATELNNNKEVEYWRGMIADLLGNPGQTYDYLALNPDYISKYPPFFRQRLAIVAADRAISAKDYNAALKILDSLHQDNLVDSVNAYVNFLMAKISLSTNQEDSAKETLDKLAEDSKFPFVQSRAEFTRIAKLLESNQDQDKIIERLERLRLSWHGDGLELKILTLLGELYHDKKDYVNAMRIWNDGVQAFANSAEAIDMSKKMEEVFVLMFSDGTADQLPPLEALALYYEYRTYMPTGAAGNEMIDRLADRLVSVDLLEQAASLLDHQMRAQTEKEQRSQIGAKLASIYLLNHSPEKALSALQDSVYGENAVLLRLERNRVTAEAMMQLGQSDKALQLLGQDASLEAEHIRVGVYWKEKDWPRVISSIEGLLKTRPDITAPVTVSESEFLIKLALAYVYENNREQVKYLRDYFGPLMAANPNKQMFEFVTADDVTPNSRNFEDVLANLNTTRTFVNEYKAHIQTAQLAPATAAAAATPAAATPAAETTKQ